MTEELNGWAFDRLVANPNQMFNEQPSDEAKNRMWTVIADKYNESSRFYHNLRHIKQCLDDLDTLQLDRPSKAALELAFWFHDIVYDNILSKMDPGANERLSAAFLQNFCETNLITSFLVDGEDTLAEAHYLIEMTDYSKTAGKRPWLMTRNEKIMRDIDFSGFACVNFEEYLELQQAVENETIAERAVYIVNRYNWLSSLDTSSLFVTDDFAHRNKIAEKNIKSELKSIREEFGDLLSRFSVSDEYK